MRIHLTLKALLFICLAFFSNLSSAIIFGPGDIARVDFDLSTETPVPPYDGIYTLMSFGASDYLDPGEGFTVALFDDGGENLNDGIGYYVLYDIMGSFDLETAYASGRIYDSSIVIDYTDYIEGTITSVDFMPDLDSALSVPYTFTNPHDQYVSAVGLDRHIVIPESVPEPSTLLLLSIGLFAIVFSVKRV